MSEEANTPTKTQINNTYRDWLNERVSQMLASGALHSTDIPLMGLDALKMRHLLSIGGTAASAIYGANPYRTAKDVYLEMLGHQEPFKGNYLTRRGQALEQLVAVRAAEIMRSPVFTPTKSSLWMKFGIDTTRWQRADLPAAADDEPEFFETQFLLDMFTCQIDALVENSRGELVILECKTAARNPSVKGGGRLWGKGIDNFTAHGCVYDKEQGCAYEPQGYMAIPYHYYLQVQWQMLCLKRMCQDRDPTEPHFNYTYAYLAADIAGCPDVRIFLIYADEQIQDKLEQAALSFMLDNVIPQEPPLSINYAAMPLPQGADAKNKEHQVTADLDFVKQHREYKELLQKIDDLKDQAEELKGKLVARMDETGDDLEEVLNPDGELLLKRTTYKRTSFDQKALKADHPELYHEYAKSTEQTRVTIY